MLGDAVTYSCRNCEVTLVTETSLVAAWGWEKGECKGGRAREEEESSAVMGFVSMRTAVMVSP